ncbi:MAG TPA: ATP-binding protein, partial [Candidatus Aquicultoraceae bacterium]|nr:ATP-binding protein [Candidatus Aquicultoraceae bacterium]
QGYQDLVELSPEAIYIQQEGRLVFVNSACLRLFGAERPNDLLGRPLSDFLPRERPEESGSPDSAGGGGNAGAFTRLDGTSVDVEVSSARIVYGGMPAVQVFARDVSGRRHLEERLRQSQKIEAVGRLAGGIAHDFNNLMTVITGYVGLTKKRLGSPDLVDKGLDEIGKASARATRLTQQLIAFSRKQILQPQILDPNHIVSNMEKMLRRLIGEDIDLVTALGRGVGRVKADPGQLEQVVVNLALNARDAMPKGGRLLIETENADLGDAAGRQGGDIPSGPCVKLVVRDDGIGMDEEIKSHIFEPYFTTKEMGKGTGLGLATVYGIIRQSGGDVRVESEPGKGTTFTIWLPRADEETPYREPPELVLDAPPGEETILVVEDEESVLTAVRDILEHAGYKVLAAADGESALSLLSKSKEPIHLLLTDVVMPKIGGQSLAARVAYRHPGTQILFMTGYFDIDIDFRDYPLGRRHCLFKPFTPQELTSKVREILDE